MSLVAKRKYFSDQITLKIGSTVPNVFRLTACFYETVRLACPPIVPHVANRDTTIAGLAIEDVDFTIFLPSNICIGQKISRVEKPRRGLCGNSEAGIVV